MAKETDVDKITMITPDPDAMNIFIQCTSEKQFQEWPRLDRRLVDTIHHRDSKTGNIITTEIWESIEEK